MHVRPPDKSAYWKNYYLHFSSKTYAAGTQKNRLNETVLLSTQNTYLNRWVRKKLHFFANKISISGSMRVFLSSCFIQNFKNLVCLCSQTGWFESRLITILTSLFVDSIHSFNEMLCVGLCVFYKHQQQLEGGLHHKTELK